MMEPPTRSGRGGQLRWEVPMERTALITGGNRGIGLETARQLRSRGLRVILGVRDVEAGNIAAADLAGDPGEVGVLALDLSSPESTIGALQTLREQGETIDVLVNNAGILESGSALDASMGTVAMSLQVNALGPTALAQGLAPGMVERGYGRIVNVSSSYGSFGEGLEGPFAYSMSKVAINALTVKLAEVLPADVKVNSCCPGWVRTRMGGPEAHRSVAEGADTIVWLALLDSDGPTGGFFRDRQQIPW